MNDIPLAPPTPIEGIQPETMPPAPPPEPISVIDLIRPDRALLRGIAHQMDRRAGKTGWEPTPRGNRVYPPNHNGEREMARRRRQASR